MKRSYDSKAYDRTGKYSHPVALNVRIITDSLPINRQAQQKSAEERKCMHTIALHARFCSNPMCALGTFISNTSHLMVGTDFASLEYHVAKSVLRMFIASTMVSVRNIAQTAMESGIA